MKLNKSLIIGAGAFAILGIGAYNYPKISAHQAQISIADNFTPPQPANPPSKNFDFYVLSLSWSPTYCQSNQGDKSPQCTSNHNFVIHGLWPQFEHGYPRECPSNVKQIDYKIVQSMLDIMPSEHLVNIEWARHGTCTALSPEKYFQTVRAAYQKLKIPQLETGNGQTAGDIETAFVNANHGLEKSMLAVTTKEGKLNEVRVCMTQSLGFRPCPEVDKAAARENTRVFIPAP